jgi:hypothetical protein
MPKSTKAQMTQRLTAVVKLRLAGASPGRIFEYSKGQGWGVGIKAIEKYVSKADAIIAARADRHRDRLLAFAVVARDRLFELALESKDYETALKVLQDRDTLLHLYPREE